MGNKLVKEKLQIIFYCMILGGLYLGISGSGEANDEETFQELKSILNVMDKHEIEVTEWTLYTREHLNHWTEPSGYFDEFMALQEKTTSFDWESHLTKQRNGQLRAVATQAHPNKGVVETLTYIVFPHNEEHHSYLIYEVEGTKKVTENDWQSLSPILSSRMNDLFQQDSKIFTCVTGNASDKLNLGLYEKAEILVNEFSGQKIEQLKEETFISVSAYTNVWNDAITTANDQNMNLQVAIREKERLGGARTVTIGTPIITTEY